MSLVIRAYFFLLLRWKVLLVSTTASWPALWPTLDQEGNTSSNLLFRDLEFSSVAIGSPSLGGSWYSFKNILQWHLSTMYSPPNWNSCPCRYSTSTCNTYPLSLGYKSFKIDEVVQVGDKEAMLHAHVSEVLFHGIAHVKTEETLSEFHRFMLWIYSSHNYIHHKL